ncbi:MAG TPA: Wzz/FepE/Etk N-terminal domain-containing protein [Roseiflexaceae bacterium]|nr:Wzz/FepE/Etk N-terminal domain-containing protein [Roseiflexaceae bacterium]
MQLTDYATVLRRRWWAILLVAAAAAVGAYIISKVQTPVYRSEASYLVVPNRADNGLSIVLQNNMDSYKVMALAPIQLEQISQQLKLDRNADWMLEHVRIQAQTDTRLMIVQADYPQDPAMAPRLADAVGNNMVALVSSLNQSIEGTDRINMRVNQPARPATLYRPQTRINVLAGAVLGLVLGLLFAFALEALDNSLKSAADVERYVDLTVLGAIPTAE